MAKKNTYPLERWTPPAEMFSTATKKTGDSGVKYTYDEPKKKRRSTGAELLQKASETLKKIDQTASSEAEMTFGKAYDPKASENGRLENTLMAGGKGWTAGQANALGFLLDPTDDDSLAETEAMLDPTGAGKKLGENKVAKWLNEKRGKASNRLYAAAGDLNDEAAEHEEKAKEGLGKLGRLLVDAGIAGTQMAADATIGRVTGTGMASIGARTFGQSAREALDAGASQQAAMNYASSSAAVEMLAEKMFDVGRIFGGGAADDLIESAVEKWAKSKAGQTALRTFFGVLTESGEEAASDLVNPMIRLFIDSDAVKQAYGTAEGRRQLWQDVKHDAAIGGILGGFGTVVNGNRSAEQQKQAKAAAEEAARRAEREQASQRQREFFASNSMRTGTADAEAAQALERNRARANRPQTAQALSRALGGEQISEAETTAILSDPELMEQMMNAIGSPIENGDVRGSFLRMMEEFGTPLQNAAESPVVEETEQGEHLPGETEPTPTQTGMGQNEPQAAQSEAEVMRRAAGIQTFADQDAQQADNGPHIDNRTPEDLRSRKVHAFQHDHPELHEHFVTVARSLQLDANGSLDTQRPGRKGGAKADYTPELLQVLNETGLSRPKLMQVLQDIIDDNGSENYADAKRVEMALDHLLSSGKYEDRGYLQKKGTIEGGTDPNSWEYALEHEYALSISLGEMTEAEARADWEAKHPQARGDSNLPEGHGAMSANFPYQEAPSQTNSGDSIFTEEERQNVEGLRPEDLQHQVRTNEDVDFHAQERLESDYEGEKADLYRDEKEWDVVDIATAWQILAQEARTARETGDWSEVVRLRKMYRDKASNWGQVGHEMSRHAHTAEDIISDAAEQLDEIGDIPPDEFSDIMRQIDEFANEWENLQEDNAEGLLDLIRRLNAARRTGGLFTPGRTGNTLNRTLEAVLQQEGGFEYLRQIAEQQIRNYANDRAPLSPIEAVSFIRYMSMLSKLTTVMRNLVGNNVFDPIESMSGNVATIPDMLMSLFTHRRTTAADVSWFSEAKRRGSVEAMQRAYIAAALDADVDGGTNRWEQRNGRTFKMAGNPISRFFSTVEKWQQYALTVTDEFQKGGIEAEAERQRQRLIDRGQLGADELQGWAEETARQRTFQNEGRVSNLMLGARNLLNSAGTLNDGRGGSFGLGDALIPFARVPGNVVGQFLNYTPAGLARGIGEMTNVLLHARNGNITAEQQAQAARDIGRGLNGTALLAGFAALAANGLLNVADGGGTDDEKDLAKLEQSEGVTGTQWNLSATQRWLSGGSTSWQNGDNLMSIGFLEPLNGLMALASLVAESAEDGDLTAGEIANNTAEAAFQAVADLPAMSSLNNIVNNFKYAEGGTGEKLGMAAAQVVGDTASSIVPNALTGIAQGMDEGTVRQTYGSDKEGLAGVAEETLNTIKGRIPGLRSTLPAALDNWGQERKTTASPLQNWLNSNILPGAVTKYSTNRANQELERLFEVADVKVPNRAAEKSVTVGENGEKKALSEDEKRAYQQVYGREALQAIQALTSSPRYTSMRDSERAAAFNAILDFATAQARQRVGGSAETPSWAEKGEGTVAENAGLYALLQAAKQTIPKDDRDKIAPQLSAVYRRGMDEETTSLMLDQLLDDKQRQKVQTLLDNEYSIEDISAFWGAKNDLKKKADTLAWAEEYGFTSAQANYMWRVFEKGA